jgi:hypothetical protein
MFMAGFIERAPAFVKSFLQAFFAPSWPPITSPLASPSEALWAGISRTRAGVATALRAIFVLPETVQEKTGCWRFATLWASDIGLIPLLPIPFRPGALNILEVLTRRFLAYNSVSDFRPRRLLPRPSEGAALALLAGPTVRRFNASTSSGIHPARIVNRRWDNRPFALGDQRPHSQPSKAAPTFAVSPAAVV